MEKELLFGEVSRNLEVLEFVAAGVTYGVDIVDVKEILTYETITKVPNSHPHMEGIIKPRDFLIPIVNVAKSLELDGYDESNLEEKMIIVSSIGDLNIGLLVDKVLGMHHLDTSNIVAPGEEISTSVEDVVLGTIELHGKVVELIEFRTILRNINSKIL